MVIAEQIVLGICCLVTTAIYCVRFYLRFTVLRRYLWIEIPLILALILQIALLGVVVKEFSIRPHSIQDAILAGQLGFAAAYLYLCALWAVKLSVTLLHVRITDKFPSLNVWAIRSVYIVAFCWIFVMATVPLGCFPPSRKWDGLVGKAKPCPNLARQWDFWVHLTMHIITDIWLCTLPFPALVHITELRLRAAVFCVYGIAFCSVIASIVRATLLGINARNNRDMVMVLSVVEVSTLTIVGTLPCISSAFTKIFMDRSSSNTYPMGRVSVTNSRQRTDFSQLHDSVDDSVERKKTNPFSFRTVRAQ